MGTAYDMESLTYNDFIFYPIKIDFFTENSIKIEKIKLGFKHTIFISENKDIYFAGDNSKGASGIKNALIENEKKIKNSILKIIKINSFLPLDVKNIKNFYCGWHNTFFFTGKS
jgi:alpha-tubulin suppressor-like RCC1 family protein